MSEDKKERQLNPMQQRFVVEYLKHGIGAKAARDAGYSGEAKSTSRDILRSPTVQAALATERGKTSQQARYGLKQAIEEVDELLAQAKRLNAMGPAAKLFETKAKLFGLLIEKHQVQTSGLTLVIKGIDEPGIPQLPIDVTPAKIEGNKDESK